MLDNFLVTLTDLHNSVAVAVLCHLGAVYVRMFLFIVERCAVLCRELVVLQRLDAFVFSCAACW